MLTKIISIFLAGVLALPAQDSPPSVKERALGTSSGSIVEVKLSGKNKPSKVRGRIGEVNDEGFDLMVARESGDELRNIPFLQVKSLKLVQRPKALPEPAKDASVPDRLRAIPKGSVVEIRSTGSQRPDRVCGRVVGFDDRGFDLLVLRGDKIVTQHFDLVQLRSVQMANGLRSESPAAKVGVGIGAVVAIALTAVAVVVVVGIVALATGRLVG
jgi:hypothetical protein